jgi:hypothetical protein
MIVDELGGGQTDGAREVNAEPRRRREKRERVGVGCLDNAFVNRLPAIAHIYSHGRIYHIVYAK